VQLQVRALFITFLTAKNEQWHLELLEELEFSRISITELHNSLDSVKIIRKKNHNFDLALQKRLFCVAKPTLLPCKTAAFGTQNNRFCKPLKVSELHDRCACEKYLQPYRLLFVPKAGCIIYFPLSDFKHLLDTKEFLIVKQSHSTRNTEDYTYNVNTLSDLFNIYVKKKRNIFQYMREIQ
jgi:hypothetical protein